MPFNRLRIMLVCACLQIAGSLAFAQADSAAFRYAVNAISESLPGFLDDNPNSLAAYTENGSMYKMMQQVSDLPVLPGMEDDKQSLDSSLIRFQQFSDSITQVLDTGKIVVRFSPFLKAYNYTPDDREWDVRDPDIWKIEQESMEEVFRENSMVLLEAPISLEYIALVRRQIDSHNKTVPLDLGLLNRSWYVYKNKITKTEEATGRTIAAGDIYWPVFNKSKTKGCYLVSIEARNGLFRTFVFIEKVSGKWVYVDQWATHQIGDEE